MAGARDQYLREMAGYFGYLAVWTPGSPLALGDVGLLHNGAFTRVTSLANLGVKYAVRSDQTTEDIAYSSADGVSVAFKAAGAASLPGSTIPEAKAGVTVEFSRKSATLFEATGCKVDGIDDVSQLAKDLLHFHRQGKWNTSWIVVTELITASAGTVFVSEGKTSKLELVAAGQVNGGTFKLTDVNLGLSISFFRDVTTRIVAQQGLTPLYRACRVEDFFGRRVKPVGPFLLHDISGATDAPRLVEVRMQDIYAGE